MASMLLLSMATLAATAAASSASPRDFNADTLQSARPPPALAAGELWTLLAVLAVLLLASFALANVVAWCLQIRRERRIQRKTQTLAQVGDRQAHTVPVTILTGFLGAGKTTLLNRILHTPSLPYKVMVLENELGTISIDHTLLQRREEDGSVVEHDGIYVLENGCMCCTARAGQGKSSGELERILDYLLRLATEQSFDYLVVETTGLADPGPIIETFLRLRASRFRLDAIVTMLDAKAAQAYWQEDTEKYVFPIELQRQALYADIVVLNKVDLASPHERTRLETAVAAINEEASLCSCVNAQVDLAQILGVNTFDAVRFREQNKTANGQEGTEESEAGVRARGQHTGGISTVHFEVEREVDVALFGEWLSDIVARYAKGASVLRVKGVLAVAGDASAQRCVVQGVLDTYTIAPAAPWASGEPRVSRLVLIGQGFDREELEHGFQQCLAGDDSLEPKKQR